MSRQWDVRVTTVQVVRVTIEDEEATALGEDLGDAIYDRAQFNAEWENSTDIMDEQVDVQVISEWLGVDDVEHPGDAANVAYRS